MTNTNNKLFAKEEYDIILSYIPYLPFNIISVGAAIRENWLSFDLYINTPYEIYAVTIALHEKMINQNKKKTNKTNFEHETIKMFVKALKKESDRILEYSFNDDDFYVKDYEEYIKTRIYITSRLSLLADMLDKKGSTIKKVNKNSKIYAKEEFDAIISYIPYLPFNATSIGANLEKDKITCNLTINTPYGEHDTYIALDKMMIDQIKKKAKETSLKHESIAMFAKALNNAMENSPYGTNKPKNIEKETVRTVIFISAKISLLTDMLNEKEFIIK